MTPEALLAELESCTHAERMRRMVDVGRRLARGQEPDLPALVAGLGSHESTYARMLALQTCMGSHDGAHVVRALEDPSRMLRSRAANVVANACDDAEAVVALGLVRGRRARAGVIAELLRRRRRGVVDAFVEATIAGKSRLDASTAELLPYASRPVLARHLPALRPVMSPLAWTRLSSWHPEVAAAELTLVLGASTTVTPRLRSLVDATLETITRRRPEIAADLGRRLLELGIEPTSALVATSLRLLARRAPGALFDVLRARQESAAPAPPPGAFAVARFDRHAERLGVDRLAYLVLHAWSTLPGDREGRRWFLRLSPADRAQILAVWLREGQESWGAFLFSFVPVDGPEAEAREAAYQRWSHAARGSSGIVDHALMDCLPPDLRIREARRHLDHVAELGAALGHRIQYARYLPFAEAESRLATGLGHPTGERRAEAIGILLRTVRFDRARLTDALALVRRKKNEQDPVRLAMFQALRSLPIRAFHPEHLETLGGAITDALDAADLSQSTVQAIEQLVTRLFRVDAAWAARWLGRIFEIRGSVASHGLADELTRADVLALAPTLTALLASWLHQERASRLILLASSLGRRLPAVPALVSALEKLAAELPFVEVASAALELLSAHAYPRFEALVPGLVTADPSFAILARVAGFVSRRRQDLLSPLLGAEPMTGRFATGKTRWAVDFGAEYFRWTPRQQGIRAATQTAILANPECAVPTARRAIEALAHLPFVSPTAILALASDPRPPVRDLAVTALSWLDQGEGVEPLLDALGDARARIAVYALRKVLQDLSEARVLRLLRAAPRGKVTVAKEIVRLLGSLGGEEAFGDLIALDQPGLHRDVRIALFRALWDHLDRPEAWAVLERAAVDPEPTIALRLFEIPVDRLSADGDARLSSLLSRVLVRPEIEGRRELLQQIATLPLADRERRLFGACLAAMSSASLREYATATAAVLARMEPSETVIVAACIQALMTEPRVLREMLKALGSSIGPYSAPHRNQVALDTLEALARDPRMATQHLWLSSHLLTWQKTAELLISLAARDALFFDMMTTAVETMSRCAEPEQLEAALATHFDARLRRLALAALETAAGRGQGWTPARRERLATFRGDFSVLVSSRALFVFPPDEAPAADPTAKSRSQS
ncbi:MAG: hypothetical protein ABJE95_18210 [Byssovorax sp.]